jgi:GNAT superfamily N-acetyltransferase
MNSIYFVKCDEKYYICNEDIEYGFCEFKYVDSVIYICYLHIDPKYRGMKYGTYLLCEVLFDTYTYLGAKHIELHDVSDRSCCKDNIYRKLGLVYKTLIKCTDGEMRGNLRHIVSGTPTFHTIYNKCKEIFNNVQTKTT